jgi:hypothetical protein
VVELDRRAPHPTHSNVLSGRPATSPSSAPGRGGAASIVPPSDETSVVAPSGIFPDLPHDAAEFVRGLQAGGIRIRNLQVVSLAGKQTAHPIRHQAQGNSERWITWERWQKEQGDRIFDEARVCRTKQVPIRSLPEALGLGPFERAIFEVWRRHPRCTRTELQEFCRRQGLPRSNVTRFLKAIARVHLIRASFITVTEGRLAS